MTVDKRQKTIRKLFDMAVILLFPALIFLPLLSKVIVIEPGIRLREERVLTGRPELDLSLSGLLSYPDEFDSFYKDNFGFRSGLVHVFSRIRSRVPGLIVGNNVLVGKDGWLFVTQNRTMDDFRGIIRLSPQQLDTIKNTMEDRKEWLAMFGIKYLLVIAPAKWEIYPDKVPGNLNRVSERTVLDQIISFLQDHSDIDLLDLRRPLRELKGLYPVYHKVDTHWNNVGLFAAVQEIKKKLSEWYPEITWDSLADYGIEEVRDNFGDLARMMGLHWTIPRIDYTLVGKKGEKYAPEGPIRGNPIGQTMICGEPSGSHQKLRTVVFHDSFGRSFHLYMKNSFFRSVYSWRYIPDTGLILRERPDVVVQELGQRNLSETLSQNPAGFVGPNSQFTGKAAKILCPSNGRLAVFRAKALHDLPVKQYLSLHINGEKVTEWPLAQEEILYSVPALVNPPIGDLSEYTFAYRYEPPGRSNTGDKSAFPFDLRAICRDNGSFVGINGSELAWSKGYNIYLADTEGYVSQSLAFDYTKSDEKNAELTEFLNKARDRKGFLLLVNRHRTGRRLTLDAKRALRAIGLKGFPEDQRRWNHIALIDLGSKKVIAEQAGSAPQRLVVGRYKMDAGFEIRSLQIQRKSD
jgi:alginate O-acetyltransferase complex protein AlgJ